jgi:hypothetical protein
MRWRTELEATGAHRLGFEICGFDTTLYRGTPHPGEVAVFMAHRIDGDARASEETS